MTIESFEPRCARLGCTADAEERAPGIYWCDEHWQTLCDAYTRQSAAGAGAGGVTGEAAQVSRRA
ncbi:MAG TPA: hypothetical protein VEI83_00445 [Acidimicrobiales bacterium]|nr:hypothetical protein [Acidimicrobiales bacterium]